MTDIKRQELIDELDGIYEEGYELDCAFGYTPPIRADVQERVEEIYRLLEETK